MREPRRSVVTAPSPEAATEATSFDGRRYRPETERELNRLAFLCFGDDNGKRFMAYLKSITLNTAFDGNISNEALRHMEGQRWLVGMIVQRAAKGAEQ